MKDRSVLDDYCHACRRHTHQDELVCRFCRKGLVIEVTNYLRRIAEGVVQP